MSDNFKPLSSTETDNAVRELSVVIPAPKSAAFRKVDRGLVDPELNGQLVSLISFVPAAGATPNKQNIYGWAKVRGTFSSELLAQDHARKLIRNHDSTSKIFHVRVGHPFPVTSSSEFVGEVEEVYDDMQKEMVAKMKTDKEKERNAKEEMKKRKAQIYAEVAPDFEEDPFEKYITTQVKKADLTYKYIESVKTAALLKNRIPEIRAELQAVEAEHPYFKWAYMDQYSAARKQVGMKDDHESLQKTFMRYLDVDVDLDAVASRPQDFE